jgi:TRAP-type C4-dicarboxylate transport system permease small subunit
MISRAILILLNGTKRTIVAASIIFVSILLWGVFSRYVLNIAVAWVEELAVYFMIWLVFLGIGVAASERGHIGMLFIRDSLPMPVKKYVILLTNLLMIGFLAVVAYEGTNLAIAVIPQKSAALRLSFFWPYMSIPAGAVLMIIQLSLVTVRDFLYPDDAAYSESELDW